MLFTSMEFLFLFFPVTISVYFFLPHQARNYWLLIVSLFFYAWGEPKFVFNMAFIILVDYFAALRMEELPREHAGRKLILTITIAINLGQMFVFKYMNFTISTIHQLLPTTQETLKRTNFILPIGISFFTFQALSYVIDVYRGIPAQKNLGYLGLYVSFFPQLIAGPIVRYTTIMEQLESREITAASFSKGVKRFLIGFNKKMLLANILAQVADVAFAMEGLSVGMAWLGAISYTLQIFFDFVGYSEMAIGLGLMFGFRFLENFNYPYISKTLTEFWRRWHISLGSWFRDYLYFPLGGSRVKSKRRLAFNLAVVWLATGIWHGANWTFLLWGMLHGIVVIIEKLFNIPTRVERKKGLAFIYRGFTLCVVVIGWVLFRADNLSVGLHYIKAMLRLSGNGFGRSDVMFHFYLREYGAILLAGLICSVPLFAAAKERISAKGARWAEVCDGVSGVVQFGLFILGVSFLVMNAHNPFIYFNF